MSDMIRTLPWEYKSGDDKSVLPVDDIPPYAGRPCSSRARISIREWSCTMPADHEDHHRAGTGRYIAAEWEGFGPMYAESASVMALRPDSDALLITQVLPVSGAKPTGPGGPR